MSEESKGLLIVYTGNGKGKTTAALGMCVRAVGYDWSICVIQFIKGSWKYGELEGIRRLEPNVEWHVVGEGFVGIVDDNKDFEVHREAARKGIELAIDKLKSGKYQLIVLDELNVALNLGLVTRDEVLAVLNTRGEKQNLVVTGRNAADWVVDAADLVTEMAEIKHPYKKGLLAQKGVDW